MNQCRHIAIIMDGNGRWAVSRGLPRTAGHLAGAENVHTIALAADRLGVQYLTLYAFSTENWKRSHEEVDYLMKLPAVFFRKYMREFIEHNFRMHIIGEMDALPKNTAKTLHDEEVQSQENTGMCLNICMNYGSRREITLAARAYAKDVLDGKAGLDLEESGLNAYLMTGMFPDVDLLIRTSGEQRISNYLLWQLAYAELEFVPENWPEFTPDRLKRCIEEYRARDRRFGGVKETLPDKTDSV